MNEEVKRRKAETFRFNAIKYYGKNDLYEAIDSLRDSIKQFETAEAYALLAYYTLKLKNNKIRSKWKDLFYGMFNSNYENIEFLYNKALSLEPKNETANLGLCDYYVQTFNYDKAIVAIKKALEIVPNNTSLHNNLGFCYVQMGEYKEAIIEFLYVSHKLRDSTSFVNLGCAFFGNKEYDNAIRFAKLALEKEPENKNAKELLNKSIKYKENPPVPIYKKIENITKGKIFILFLILSLFLLIGSIADPRDLFDGYYMLLRLFTSGVCLYSAVKFKTEWAKWIFGGLTVLYNPVLPIHLGDKDAWTVINLITIIYMWAALYFENKARKP